MTAEPRPPEEVLEDHLHLRSEGRLQDDLARNYDPKVIVFSSEGRFESHEGLRKTAEILNTYVNQDNYEYLERHVHGDLAFLTWKAREDGHEVHGSDTFVIQDGRIVVQTIHFVRMKRETG